MSGDIITLKQNNATGTDIPFDATIYDHTFGYDLRAEPHYYQPDERAERDGVPRSRGGLFSGTLHLPAVPQIPLPPSPSRWTRPLPTVSSIAYTDAASGGSTLTSTTGGDEIYTTVTFSEPVWETVSDSIGFPHIVYRVGAVGAETRYDIVADTATLASGDCQETGTEANDKKVYTCRYDTIWCAER